MADSTPELSALLSAVFRRSMRRIGARYLWELEFSLRKHGIEIPFPQRDLHLRSGFERLQPPNGA